MILFCGKATLSPHQHHHGMDDIDMDTQTVRVEKWTRRNDKHMTKHRTKPNRTHKK